MNLKLCLVLLLLSSIIKAQNTVITGTVTDNQKNEPVPFASVFLSNSSFHTQTDKDGRFTLKVPVSGQYDFIVSFIGYDTFTKSLIVKGENINVDVKFIPKSITLNTVTVSTDIERQKHLKMFLKDFIGATEDADKCKVLNTEAIWLRYDKNKGLLEASSDEFLIIENKALGYRIKYLLEAFKRDYRSGMLYYQGKTYFEDLTGSSPQMKRWLKKRDNVYYGSSMHFFRTLIKGNLQKEDYQLFSLKRYPNPGRLPDSLITAKRKYFYSFQRPNASIYDSISFWNNMYRKPRVINTLSSQGFPTLSNYEDKNMSDLSFEDYLYIVYKGKKDFNYPGVYRPVEVGNYPVSIIGLKNKHAYFDSNGIVANPKDVVFEGSWVNGVADLLPYNFLPSR